MGFFGSRRLSFFRTLKLLCYFGTYGMYTCEKFLRQIFVTIELNRSGQTQGQEK